MTLFVAPSSSSSSSPVLPLLARVMFVAVALVFASATRSVSAKVYFSETFDGTGNKKSKRVSILFFFFFFLLSSFSVCLAAERTR